MKPRQQRIALIGLPVLQSVNNLLTAAIARHAEQTGRWKFVFSAEASVDAFRFLRRLDCEGAIVRVTTAAMRREARRVPFPMVNVSAWLEDPDVPTVRQDFRVLGKQAAEYLLEKGFRRFGCVVVPGGWYIQARLGGFIEALRARGFKAAQFVLEKAASTDEALLHRAPIAQAERQRFIAWVKTLQPPAALLLTDDWDAPVLMDACREAGWQIPRDLVVISTGMHSEVLCHCHPPLTAAQEDMVALARLAIETLEHLMIRKTGERPLVNVPPLGVVERESTATMAIEDREVAHAVEFIRAHAGEGINVGDIATRAGVSRVTLERHFRQVMGHTLHHYLIRHRIRRAQELLLAEPPPPLQRIARQCGFPDRRRLNQVFRSVVGKSPAAWQLQQRLGAPQG